MIEESYGNNFSFESTGSATNKEMTVEFHPTLENDFRAATDYDVNPSQINEGMAEFTQGADDKRISDLMSLAVDVDKLNNVFCGDSTKPSQLTTAPTALISLAVLSTTRFATTVRA